MIRLMAWSQIPKVSDKSQVYEPYDCEIVCGSGAEWNDKARAHHRCSRKDLPPVEWDVSVKQLSPHMGRERLKELAGERDYHGHWFNWMVPPEDPDDGCPGGWYRNPFAYSLRRYIRSRSREGTYSENHFLSQTDDPLIIAAIQAYESALNSSIFHAQQSWNEEMTKRSKAKS